MAVWTWDPVAEIESLRREIDRAFETAGVPAGERRMASAAFLPGLGARRYPLINVREDAANYYVEALAPGLDPGSIDVSLQQGVLRLAGEKSGTSGVSGEAYHRTERATGRFARTVALPGEVNESRVAADYRHGILVVTLPKAEAARPRQITVKTA